jgi:kynurenine formamidase
VTLLPALGLVQTGRVVDLSEPVDERTPRWPGLVDYTTDWWNHPAESARALAAEGATNGPGFADERVTMDLHTGTHIDALGHAFQHSCGHGGVSMDEVAPDATGRLSRLGVDEIAPIIGRGVLLDVAGTCGRDLAGGDAVTRDDLETAARHSGVQPGAGDVVLVRTGWGRYYSSDRERYARSWPGLDIGAARWCSQREVAAVAADNIALEVVPETDPAIRLPVHLHLLVEAGIPIIEMAALEELAALRATEFLCLCLPLKFRGATASPVRLLAVV